MKISGFELKKWYSQVDTETPVLVCLLFQFKQINAKISPGFYLEKNFQ